MVVTLNSTTQDLPKLTESSNARRLTFLALRHMDRKATYANVALDRFGGGASTLDRHLATELVYGITRRQRTLDALITRFAAKPADQQPPDLRRILHIGFYQLCFLTQIPEAAAVNTSVALARNLKLGRLAGVVNGTLRGFLRSRSSNPDLTVQDLGIQSLDPKHQLGILHSFPDWIVDLWCAHLGETATADLCQWFNQVPSLDLRVNTWLTTLETVEAAFAQAGIQTCRISTIPSALRLIQHSGEITQLPGFIEGWWSIQDASAQQVSYWLDPQPGEMIIDCCAAPGGKTTHCAELMQNQGQLWAFDRNANRLNRVLENANRLQLSCIQAYLLDCANPELNADLPAWHCADRVLVDAPCSGLGTLHRHADARWRQSPSSVQDLVHLQAQILKKAAQWVKPGGSLVYATCTLHPQENEGQIQAFLEQHPTWELVAHQTIWPHLSHQDGFFIAKLQFKP